MPTITLIGAGSMIFAKNLIGDVLSYPELADSTIRLMDIDETRLNQTATVAAAMARESNLHTKIETTTDRAEALDGADYVLNMINVGGAEPFENEIRIPEHYGVKQSMGATINPGGVFRALRTIPTMLDLAKEMSDLCPEAPLLNYTNPMAMVTWAVDEATDIDIYGLCHSVQGTAKQIADFVDIPFEELDYWVAGINHMAWFLEAEYKGESVYPALFNAMEDSKIYRRDTVRFEIMRHFGSFVTESSGHMSQYVPYFRQTDEKIEEMQGIDMAERMDTAYFLEQWKAMRGEQDERDPAEEDLTIERSHEYGVQMIHSMEKGKTRRVNANLSNECGAISNLPHNACVEVPCIVDGTGVHPCTVGDLPPQLAALNRTNINVQELTVRAALDGDREAVHQAVKLDPLTAAVLDLPEIHEMTEELLAANEAYLPNFN